MKQKRRGLLAYPLRRVISSGSTTGGNPNTNPARSWFKLECGHTADLPGPMYCNGNDRRKAFRCEDCPKS